MKKMIFFAFLLAVFVFMGHPTGALRPVTDVTFDAGLTQIPADTLVPMEAEVHVAAAAVADTPTPMTVPADSVGAIAVWDGGAAVTQETEATEFMPALAGVDTVSVSTSGQVPEAEVDVFADEARANPPDRIF